MSLMPVYLFIGVFILAANLPFISKRFFWMATKKNTPMRLFECLVYFTLCLLFGRYLESLSSPVQSQSWPFYAALIALFFTTAFPSFVYCYLWPKPTQSQPVPRTPTDSD